MRALIARFLSYHTDGIQSIARPRGAIEVQYAGVAYVRLGFILRDFTDLSHDFG